MNSLFVRFAIRPPIFRSCRRAKSIHGGQQKMMAENFDRHDHLQITANQTRNEVTSAATIAKITRESKTVRGITLQVEDPEFHFKPGQWLDVFIPEVKETGGFSICSSPCKLRKTKEIDLAVKFSERAPAFWFHSQCQIGSKVSIRAGGDFHFDTRQKPRCQNTFLIAGGVGVNPLASIFQYCADLHRAQDVITPEKVLLLYSANEVDELLFRKTFLSITQEIPAFQCKFFVTGTKEGGHDFPVEYARIQKMHIQEGITWLGGNSLTSYICGPLTMINEMKSLLENLGISQDKILFEKWW